MRSREFIVESSGDISRRWFETQSGKFVPFIDKNGDEWEISDIQYFPPNPNLKYEGDKPKDQLLRDVSNYLRHTYASTDIRLYGSGTGAGMLVILTNLDDDSEKAFLKLFPSKRDLSATPLFWGTTYFAKDSGMIPQTPQMKKAVIPLDPANLIRPSKLYSVESLINGVAYQAKKIDVEPILYKNIKNLLTQVHLGLAEPIDGLTPFRSVIEIKLGEIAAPIALASGQLLSGQFNDLWKSLLGPAGYEFGTAYISFPDKQERLIDSYLHLPNSQTIAISCKSGSNGGAKPSTAIIAQTLADKQEEFADATFQKKYGAIIQAINTLNDSSAIDGPLDLAVRYDLINNEDHSFIKTIYGSGRILDKDLKRVSPHLYLLYKTATYNPDPHNVEYQTGYHLLAIVARLVAAKINNDPRLTQFFKAVLNKSDLVQITSRTKVSGDALCFKDFQVIYPPTFQGSVRIDCSSYTSRTKPTRKFSFTFEK